MKHIDKIGIDWQVGLPSGWGTYGRNLCEQLLIKGYTPVPALLDRGMHVDPVRERFYRPLFKENKLVEKMCRFHGGMDVPFPVLHALDNQLDYSAGEPLLSGEPGIGVVFFELSVLGEAFVARAKERFPLIITGSSWNTDVLKEHGYESVAYCPQGIDTTLFHPAPAAGLFKDRFMIFSGGKLEYRKGQDIVVAAFKEFHKRHPEAMLVTAWQNRWPESMKMLGLSDHVTGVPEVGENRVLKVTEWLVENGVPSSAVLDLGECRNADMPSLLREMDVALFPNRSEGGTNLVAMEAMACGVPVILSDNTGHKDLIAPDQCYVLSEQPSIGVRENIPGLRDWGESSVDEILAQLEAAYANREKARAIGLKGADFMAGWNWSAQVDRLLGAIAPYCS